LALGRIEHRLLPMQPFHSLATLPVTNQCVVVCDLALLENSHSEAWFLLGGTQDAVGMGLAEAIRRHSVRRLDDFGGVSKTLLCDGEIYLASPPATKPGAAVFSFTPKKRLVAEAAEMARVSRLAGYSLLILTLQKHDKYGKVWALIALLRHLSGDPILYYEDTNSVVDELKSLPEGTRVVAVHVQAPGFEAAVSKLADRVVSQSQYRQEVLV
jgi:hypothetical protein